MGDTSDQGSDTGSMDEDDGQIHQPPAGNGDTVGGHTTTHEGLSTGKRVRGGR